MVECQITEEDADENIPWQHNDSNAFLRVDVWVTNIV